MENVFKVTKRYNIIKWQKISTNISALRSSKGLVVYNKAIANFACKYLSSNKNEYDEKYCDKKNCDNCDYDKFDGYVSINALAKALTICNRLNGWYNKIEIITTDMLRLWEIGKVKPPLEYIVLLTDICSLKIEDIVFNDLL